MSATDTSDLERAVWVLVAAVVGLILSQAAQAWVRWRDRVGRDRRLIRTLGQEIAVVRGLAVGLVNDLNAERTLLQNDRWRLNPLPVLPSNLVALTRPDMPRALLREDAAVSHVLRIDHQARHTNLLADRQATWKAPGASSHSDQLDVIRNLNVAVGESVEVVVERCDMLVEQVHNADRRLHTLRRLWKRLRGKPFRD